MNSANPPPTSPPAKPGIVTTLAVLTLVSGIWNILWAVGLTASVVLGTFFLGIFCAPFTILPAVLGIFEILYAARLLPDPPQPTQPSLTLAVLQIMGILLGNILSFIVGILALIFYNDQSVRKYFAQISAVQHQPPPSV
jgi:hypothetical protein